MIGPCQTCSFQPWSRDEARCEAKKCVAPAVAWFHGEGGVHFLVCAQHKAPNA